jgi:hypothetical protein
MSLDPSGYVPLFSFSSDEGKIQLEPSKNSLKKLQIKYRRKNANNLHRWGLTATKNEIK